MFFGSGFESEQPRVTGGLGLGEPYNVSAYDGGVADSVEPRRSGPDQGTLNCSGKAARSRPLSFELERVCIPAQSIKREPHQTVELELNGRQLPRLPKLSADLGKGNTG